MSVPALLRSRPAVSLVLIALILAVVVPGLAQSPALPRCGQRPTSIHELYVDHLRWCPEHVVHDPDIEAFAFTALEVSPNGTLYATRPLTGEVMRISDSDGDDLPDDMQLFVSGLTKPNGLAFHRGKLYVSGGANIYRVSETATVETLVTDLPTGTGFWTGGLAIGPDERLYVAIGAPCSDCAFDDPERGVILSMDLDGGDRQLVASGFRHPADLAFFRDQLWTLDSAPRQSVRNALDELNRVQAGGFYGFPYCLAADTSNIASVDFTCADSIPPVMSLGSGSIPTSLAAYPHDTLPGTVDTLIVVLSGDPRQIDIVGYKVIMISFDASNQPLGAAVLIPFRLPSNRQAYKPYNHDGMFWDHFIHINEVGFGFYPQQPLSVAVDPRGWIYISLTGGRIIALRPRYETQIGTDTYPIWSPMNPNFDPSLAPAPIKN